MAEKKRKQWIAFVLSLLFPGLGHVYAGMQSKGLASALLPSLLTILFGCVLFLIKESKLILVSSVFFFVIMTKPFASDFIRKKIIPSFEISIKSNYIECFGLKLHIN